MVCNEVITDSSIYKNSSNPALSSSMEVIINVNVFWLNMYMQPLNMENQNKLNKNQQLYKELQDLIYACNIHCFNI